MYEDSSVVVCSEPYGSYPTLPLIFIRLNIRCTLHVLTRTLEYITVIETLVTNTQVYRRRRLCHDADRWHNDSQ